MAENDKLMAGSPAAIGYKPPTHPSRAGSGLQRLQQNPSKNYFNNAGIAGQNPMQAQNPYTGQVAQQ